MAWSVGAGIEGKGVIVTGAAGGMGRPVAEAFAAAGAKVMAVDLHADAAAEVVAGLEGEGHVAAGLDLSDLDAQTALVERAKSELGGVYALAHLAAVLRRRDSLGAVTEDDWDFQVDTNLKASFFLCRAVAEAMKEGGEGGRIIAFTSQGWWTGGFGGSVVYCASKGGIVSMVRGLARTFGPDGITVNAVAPGQIETPMLMTDLDPAVLQRLLDATPLGRIGQPEEMAGTVVFLASQHASYISGATINVSGGQLMY
ncbi:MAG: SDR family NAD(P)-dependent oxidoreductase [Acidimicrobiales bacterium]